MTRGRGLAIAAVVLATAAEGRADTKRECLVAVDQGQIRRSEGKLIDAKAQFAICAAEECPAVVRNECAGWLADVEGAIASVIVTVKSPDGVNPTNLRVTIDGTAAPDARPGAPIALDPGEHQLRFELPGSLPAEATVVVAAGERGHRTDVMLQAVPAKEAPARPPARSNVPAYVLGSVGLAAGASFAFFGISGIDQLGTLRDTCSPHCPHDDVDDAHRKLLVADVSLAVGVVSLGLLAWWLISGRGPPSAAPARAP